MPYISKATLLTLSDARLSETRALLAAREWSGAYYLAGYSLELRLKARISDKFQGGGIPDLAEVRKIYTHNIHTLINLADLGGKHAAELQTNRNFAAHWAVVSEWNEESRYMISDQVAATGLLEAIVEPQDGIMAWLARHS